jgi:hypothetical protein
MKKLLSIVLPLLLVSCATRTVKVGGHTYKKISNAKAGKVELWERSGDSTHYYTPSLQWRLHPNGLPSFVRLNR